MPRKVYIANRGYHNYEAAKKFGELVALTVGDVDLMQTDRLEGRMQEKLLDSSPDDFLMLGGAPILGALAQGFLYRLHGQVNLMYWDPLEKDYIVRDGLTFEHRKLEDSNADDRPDATRPNWHRTCKECGAVPIVPATGKCGPHTFGDPSTAGGNW